MRVAIAAKSSRVMRTSSFLYSISIISRMYTSIGSEPVSVASLCTRAQKASGSMPIFGSTVYSCIGCGDNVPSKSYTMAMVFWAKFFLSCR